MHGQPHAMSIGTAHVDRRISEFMVEIARGEAIPYQLYVESGATSTGVDVVQIVRGGVIIGLLNIPQKYMHSRVGVVSLRDLEESSKLLTRFLEKIVNEEVFKREF